MSFNRKIAIFCALAAALSSSAKAEVFRDDFRIWRRAKTINSGQHVWALQSSYQNFTDRFTADGRVEPLGDQYARALTWDQLVATDSTGRAELEAYMRKNHIAGDEIAATSTYEVRRQELGFNFNWAYGLTRGWMIGFQLPARLTTTRVEQVVETTPQLANAEPSAERRSILGLQGSQLRERIKQLAEKELSNNGFDKIPTQKQVWSFGDISLLSQFEALKGYYYTWSLQQVVRFPTAQNPSPSDYVQSSRDEGPVNAGLTSLFDFYLRAVTLGLRAGYVAQLPDTARMRAPPGSESDATVDPKVKRDLGDWAWAAFDAEAHVSRRLDFSLEYSFLSKGKDRYTGDRLTRDDYDRLALHTDQQLHQTRAGINLRLGPASSRNGVANKWMVALDYTYPWIGRNASEAARTSLEITNYF